ncbi:hypothetical protein ACFE04_004659 [Oxalis oulophora]
MENFCVKQNTDNYRTTKHDFKLSFQYRTLVRAIPEFTVSLHGFSFTPLHEIIEQGREVPHLVDSIGFLPRVGTKIEYDKDGKRTRMNVIELTSNGFAKGKDNVCSQRLSQLSDYSNYSIEDDFLRLIPRKTIYGIHSYKEDIVYVTLATIVHFTEGEKWWYTACNKCNKFVLPKSGMYHCDSCKNFVSSVSLRYRLKVVVDDEFDCASFVIFDRDVVDCTPSSGHHVESIHLGADEDSAIDNESITKVPSISKKRFNEIMESSTGDESKNKDKGLRQYAKVKKEKA